MNKSEPIETLRKETDLSLIKSKQVVELFFYEMPNALGNGDRVEIKSFLQHLCEGLVL